ncbi:MAG: hypothetical protein ACK5IJ_06895 [Mangrovibacterium sp.]
MKKILMVLMVLGMGMFATAQPSPEQIEQFKSQKVSYMTDRLSLTSEEAQLFWPIYNKFDELRWKQHERRRTLEQKLRDSYDKLGDKDFQQINAEMNLLAQNELNLVLKYNAEFLKVLPAKKVVLIAPAENDFRFRMIKDYRKKQRDEE